jgi:hypothetical protein
MVPHPELLIAEPTHDGCRRHTAPLAGACRRGVRTARFVLQA